MERFAIRNGIRYGAALGLYLMPENQYSISTLEYRNMNGTSKILAVITATRYTHKAGSLPSTKTATDTATINATAKE